MKPRYCFHNLNKREEMSTSCELLNQQILLMTSLMERRHDGQGTVMERRHDGEKT